jgi:thioredoxin-related protein
MKRLTLITVLFFTTYNFVAQVKFESSLTEAFKLAKEQNKIVFVDYYNSECSVCKHLSELLQTDTIVANYYNKYFINYKLDTKGSVDGKLREDEKNLLEKSKLTFDHVPILLFFDSKENFLHHSGAKIDSDVVLNIGKSARHPDYRSSSNSKKYNEGDRSIKTLYAYSVYLVATSNDSLLKIVTKDLYDVYSKDSVKMSSISSYTILKNVINTTENGFFTYWMTNLDKLKDFEQGYKKGQEKEALEKILLKELSNPDRINWSEAKKNIFKDYVFKLKITDNPDTYFE